MNSTLMVHAVLNTTKATLCRRGHSDNETYRRMCGNISTTLSTIVTSPTPTPTGESESRTSLIIRFFLTAMIFVLIVIGNSLTIHVVRNNRNLTSIKNYYYGYYIVNLSISDLLVGLVCIPTTVLYYVLPGRWVLGLFLCKLFPTLQIMVVSASISTLTVITFERFSAIVHPLKPRSTIRKLWLKIAAIWIWSVIIALPSFIAYQIDSNQVCQEKGIGQWYTILLFLVNYAVPLTFIFVTYIRMLYELNSQSQTGSKRELASHKRFIKLTIILVLGFAICYLPSNIVFFILEFTVVSIDERSLSTMIQYFHLLIWFNSCLNPFIYGSVDTYFKRGFKKAFGFASNSDSQQDKTNCSAVTRGGTPKSERGSPAAHRWLPPELPKQQSPLLNGSPRLVRFEPGGQHSSLALNCNNNQPQQHSVHGNEQRTLHYATTTINDRGYARTVNRPIGCDAMSADYNVMPADCSLMPGDCESDENQELFVDLGSRTPSLSLEKRLLRNHVYKALPSYEELLMEFHNSKETDL
eukprot:gene15724-17309_t